MNTTTHHPVTPDQCAEDIRNYGHCEHGNAYPDRPRTPFPAGESITPTAGDHLNSAVALLQAEYDILVNLSFKRTPDQFRRMVDVGRALDALEKVTI